jgi:hypothetical protein
MDFARSSDALSLISEWAKPDVLSPVTLPYSVLVLALIAGAVRGRLRPVELWIVLPILMFGLTAERSLYPAAILLTPVAAGLWTKHEISRPIGIQEARLNTALAVVLLILLPAGLAARTWPVGIDPEVYPVSQLDDLRGQRTWTSDSVGGVMIYARWPDTRVFIDDRAELYGGEFMRDFVAVRSGDPKWQSIFAEHGITAALTKSDWGVSRSLRQAGWTVISRGGDWVLWKSPR